METQTKYRIKRVFNNWRGHIVYVAQRKYWFGWYILSDNKWRTESCAQEEIDEMDRIKKIKAKYKIKYINYEPKN